MITHIVFWLTAVIAVAAGAAVFWVNSMARATYALAASFVAVGVVVLLMQQNYIGVIVILMMVMEMAVMAVYMVMFMGMNPALMPMSMVHGTRLSLAIAIAVFAVLSAGVLLVDWPARGAGPRRHGRPGGGADGLEDAGDDRRQPGDGGHHHRRGGAGQPAHPLRPVR